jgi:predicted component of type VI protein secretion system
MGADETEQRLSLLVTAGNALGAEIRVTDELVIGRQEEGIGALANDAEISRRHARIAPAPDGFSIEDLGSTNGTLVNGAVIAAPHTLSAGDTIEVGGTTLLVESVGAATVTGAAPPAETTSESPPVTTAGADAGGAAKAAAAPPLSFQVDVDLESGEVRLTLDDESEPVRLVNEGGRWRVATD